VVGSVGEGGDVDGRRYAILKQLRGKAPGLILGVGIVRGEDGRSSQRIVNGLLSEDVASLLYDDELRLRYYVDVVEAGGAKTIIERLLATL